MLRLATFLAALVIAPCQAQPRPTISPDTDPRDRPVMLRLLAGMYKACPNAKTYARYFSNITLQAETDDAAARRLDWQGSLFVTVHIADGSAFMPVGLANTPSFAFAHFVVGGSPHPGVVAWSPGARVLCGLPALRQGQDEPFIPVPSLAFFKGWAPDPPRDPHAPPLDGTAYPLGADAPPSPASRSR